MQFRDSVYVLSEESSQVGNGIAIDAVLAVFLLVSIIVNCTTLGTPLTKKKKNPEGKIKYNKLQVS